MGTEWQRPRYSKLVLLSLLAALVAGLAIVHASRRSNQERLERINASTERLQSLTRSANRLIESRTAELKALEHGPEGWQALARKEYGLLLPGELIYRFPPTQPIHEASR